MLGLTLLMLPEICRVQQGGSEPDQAQLVKRLEAIFPISSGPHAKVSAAAPAAAPPQVFYYIRSNTPYKADQSDLLPGCCPPDTHPRD